MQKKQEVVREERKGGQLTPGRLNKDPDLEDRTSALIFLSYTGSLSTPA